MKKLSLQIRSTVAAYLKISVQVAICCLVIFAFAPESDLNAQRSSQLTPQQLEQLESLILAESNFLRDQINNPNSPYNAADASILAEYYQMAWHNYTSTNEVLSVVFINQTNFFGSVDNGQTFREALFYQTLREAVEGGAIDPSAGSSAMISSSMSTQPLLSTLLKEQPRNLIESINVLGGNFSELNAFFNYMRSIL